MAGGTPLAVAARQVVDERNEAAVGGASAGDLVSEHCPSMCGVELLDVRSAEAASEDFDEIAPTSGLRHVGERWPSVRTENDRPHDR